MWMMELTDIGFQVDLLKTVRNERPTYWRLVTPGLEVAEVEELC